MIIFIHNLNMSNLITSDISQIPLVISYFLRSFEFTNSYIVLSTLVGLISNKISQVLLDSVSLKLFLCNFIVLILLVLSYQVNKNLFSSIVFSIFEDKTIVIDS